LPVGLRKCCPGGNSGTRQTFFIIYHVTTYFTLPLPFLASMPCPYYVNDIAPQWRGAYSL
ncbi:hypothetical protein, partial [Arenibacter certesii]|uniref:hypothetical protein n=1 Tax=Arenibacter certesii TaxID=228955 RepID=UPI001969AE14